MTCAINVGVSAYSQCQKMRRNRGDENAEVTADVRIQVSQ